MDFMEKATAFIKRNEGFRPTMYKCPAGKWTIGYGHNLSDKGISRAAADVIFTDDFAGAYSAVRWIFENFDKFTVNRQVALVDMMFNLGEPRFCGFKKMIKAIKSSDWKRAAAEAKDSRWYGQVGARGKAVVGMLLEG